MPHGSHDTTCCAPRVSISTETVPPCLGAVGLSHHISNLFKNETGYFWVQQLSGAHCWLRLIGCKVTLLLLASHEILRTKSATMLTSFRAASLCLIARKKSHLQLCCELYSFPLTKQQSSRRTRPSGWCRQPDSQGSWTEIAALRWYKLSVGALATVRIAPKKTLTTTRFVDSATWRLLQLDHVSRIAVRKLASTVAKNAQSHNTAPV